jgi:hypothetical protein
MILIEIQVVIIVGDFSSKKTPLATFASRLVEVDVERSRRWGWCEEYGGGNGEWWRLGWGWEEKNQSKSAVGIYNTVGNT